MIYHPQLNVYHVLNVLAVLCCTIVVHPDHGKYPAVVFKRKHPLLVFLPDLLFHNRSSQSTTRPKSYMTMSCQNSKRSLFLNPQFWEHVEIFISLGKCVQIDRQKYRWGETLVSQCNSCNSIGHLFHHTSYQSQPHNRRWCTFFQPVYLFPQRTR